MRELVSPGPDTAVQISKALAKKVKEEKIEVIENTIIIKAFYWTKKTGLKVPGE